MGDDGLKKIGVSGGAGGSINQEVIEIKGTEANFALSSGKKKFQRKFYFLSSFLHSQ
jgi:hypothetical protein